MKTLIVTRHAKSDWGNLSQQDFDRPLSERGERDAPMMGKRLAVRGIMPDLILSSSARRAEQTALLIATAITYPANKIEMTSALYHASALKMIQLVEALDDHHQTVMIVCHNPGITHFVNLHAGIFTDNVPTCGMTAFDIEANTWKDFEMAEKKFSFYDYPKNL